MDPDSKRKIKHVYCSQFTRALGGSLFDQTVLILTASMLAVPESITSAFGGLGYLAFLMIPVGMFWAGRVGVHRSMGQQMFFTGLCGIIIGFLILFFPSMARGPYLVGILLLHMANAAAGAMQFPMQRALNTPKTLPGFLAMQTFCYQIPFLMLSLGTAWFLKVRTDLPWLSILFFVGGASHFLAALSFRTMGDIKEIREETRRDIFGNIREALHDRTLKRFLLSGTIMDLALIMLPPMCILASQKGMGCNGNQLMILNTVRILSVCGSAFLYRKISMKFGPRFCMLGGLFLLLALVFFWLFIPVGVHFACLAIPMVLSGMIGVIYGTGQAHYFTASISSKFTVSGTILVYLFHGALAGILGMILNPLIYKLIWSFPCDSPMTHYRWFFTTGFALFLIGGCAIYRLPKEKNA